MLAALSIRDIVLIDRMSLAFQPGLSVLTGETGAGKSILLDALGLALGARGDAGLIRRGASQAQVTAEFDLPYGHPALGLLAEQGLDADARLILRRVLSPDGRSRAFVNDQPVGVALLRRLAETLVEIHGQFDTHGLLNPQTHRAILDEYGRLGAQADRVAAAWRGWRQVETARREAAESAGRARAEEDYLRHTLAEIDELDPKPGEEASLGETRTMLMHREKLVEAMNSAFAELSGSRGASVALNNARRALVRAADRAAGRFDAALAALDRAEIELGEAVTAIQSLSADTSMDGAALEKAEERLFALRSLARKHGIDADGLPALRAGLAERLSLIEDEGDALARLAKQAALARNAYLEASREVGEARRQAGARLDREVAGELGPLRMGKAHFLTSFEALPEDQWSAAGTDSVAFHVATNPGSLPGPLNRIASGGEMARFMLALKVVLAQTGTTGTLVFDEVDSGIGGAVADAVGERLARLGSRLQVLVVTHSPQVAARGAFHWRVEKSEAGEGTVTQVVALSDSGRREEIARMLSGARITDEARAAAARLMEPDSALL